jgi:hypothetical protein
MIQATIPPGPNPAMLTSFRKDIWHSRADAETFIRKSRFFRNLDSRVVDKYVQYGLREVPTAIYPLSDKNNVRAGAVTLAATKHQEAWTYVRSNFNPLSADPLNPRERLISPDQDPLEEGRYMFVCAGTLQTFVALPQVRPAVLWVFGSSSQINIATRREEKMKCTGIGRGGSRGKKARRVKEIVIDKAGHLVPFEKVSETAHNIRRWMDEELKRYLLDEEFHKTYQSHKSEGGRIVSNEWMKGVELNSDAQRPAKERL